MRAGPIVRLAPSCSIPILYIVYSYSIYVHITISAHMHGTHMVPSLMQLEARGLTWPHLLPSLSRAEGGQCESGVPRAPPRRAVVSPPATIPQSPPHIPSRTSIIFSPPCARLGVMHAPTRTGNQRTDMGFVNDVPFIRFRQLTKLFSPGGRV